MLTPKAHDADIPALTALRFWAAITVVLAHGAAVLLRTQPELDAVTPIEALPQFGMSLFFVLSGFVIHYNYRFVVTKQGLGGIAAFAWARFARLYPLFALFLVVDLLFGEKLWAAFLGNATDFSEVFRALPYYLALVQSWVYIPFSQDSLTYVVGGNISLSWSISTEWFFYLSYPLLAILVLKLRGLRPILITILGWSLIWAGLAWWLYGQIPRINTWAAAHYGDLAAPSLSAVRFGAPPIQDTFFRWLLYFSPYLRIGEFVLGCLTAQLFLHLRDRRPVEGRERWLGPALAALAALTVPIVLLLTYGPAPVPFFVALQYNFGLAPTAAVLIFAATRYGGTVGRVLSSRAIVALGEATYSMYLLHFVIFEILARELSLPLPLTASNVAYLTVRFAFAIVVLLLLSLGLYTAFEVPARRWLRSLWRQSSSAGVARPSHRRWAGAIAVTPLLAALLCLASQNTLFPDRSRVDSGIQVMSATYGASCGAPAGNATRVLISACNGLSSCDYNVEVTKLGDPAGGCSKDFTLAYRCVPDTTRLDIALPAEAGLGSHVHLDCRGGTDPPLTSLTIA